MPQSVGGGLTFPGAFDAEHVTHYGRVAGDGGPNTRWAVSDAMEKVFLPNRLRILTEFLSNGSAPEHSK